MRYLVGFMCVLALGVMSCSGESDGICRGSLSDYCAKVECPTWDEAVAKARCDGFWEVGTCEDLGYVFYWFGMGDHTVKYFDASGALVAVEAWSDYPAHCDSMSNSILYGPVPHCDRCPPPFSDYCLFDCPTWGAQPQCEGFESTLVDASDCWQADRYCASNCPLQDREECVEQYLSTGSCGTGGTGGNGGGRWDDWFWGEDCPGCRCEGDPSGEIFHTTLECLCCKYLCEPGPGPLPACVWQTITEYDCDRRVISEEIEEWREFVIDTTTGDVVHAMFSSDYGICISHGLFLSAGDSGLAGCEVTSERTCDGCCGAGGADGSNVGAFEVQP